MMTVDMPNTILKDRIGRAVNRLMTAQTDVNSTRVSVPVVYPSGAMSTVEVSLNGDKCFVSDMGIGHTEALLSNAQDYYDTQAKRAAERFGIGYDGDSIFVLWAPVSRMEGAIASVANASVQAASLAIMKATEDRELRKNDELYDRIRSIFAASTVTRTADLTGRNAVWSAHNVVALPSGRVAVFEFVRAHTNSISNKFMMFSDLALSGQNPSLNSVVRSIEAIGVKGGMLADVSNVIPLNSSNDDFLRYARLAA